MRIQQLAKALNITVSEIEEFLQEKVDAGYDSPNKKLEEDVVQIVLDRFGPLPEKKVKREEDETPVKREKVIEVEKTEKIIEEASSEETPQENKEETGVAETPNEVPEEKEKIVEEEKSTSPEPKATEIIDTGETTLHIEDGVIKAPKVDLPGIKVTGKIDLPEPKPKATEEESTENDEEKTEASSEEKIIPEKPKFERKKRTPRKRPSKRENGPTVAEIKAKEEADRLKREAEIEAKRKKAKKEFYKTYVQPKASKATKKKDKKKSSDLDQHVAPQPKALQKKEAPKSAWGKFIKWLNS